MKHLFNTPINSFSEITYGQLAVGIAIAITVVGFVVYNILKTERVLKGARSKAKFCQ